MAKREKERVTDFLKQDRGVRHCADDEMEWIAKR